MLRESGPAHRDAWRIGLPAGRIERVGLGFEAERKRGIWVGEMLHPGEHATPFPGAARVFSILRNGQDGRGAASAPTLGFAARVKTFLGLDARPGPAAGDAPAPRPAIAHLSAWPTAVEAALARNATGEALVLLSQRPGDFLRRFDVLLRRARQREQVIEAFGAVAGRATTPALVALRAHMAVPAAALPARVFWPRATFYVPRARTTSSPRTTSTASRWPRALATTPAHRGPTAPPSSSTSTARAPAPRATATP